MSFEARNALMLAKKVVDEAAKFKKAIQKAGGGAAKAKVIPHGDKERENNLATFLKGNHPEVPHVVYHGSSGDFKQFDPSMALSEGGAFYFSRDAFAKPGYGAVNAASYAPRRGGSIYPVHLSMKNPYITGFTKPMPDDPEQFENWMAEQEKFDRQFDDDRFKINYFRKAIANAHKNGHDGVIIKNVTDDKIHRPIFSMPSDIFVAFHPTQIKSATGNQGTFDPTNPDITKAGGGEVARKTNKIGLYSKAAEQARQLPSGSVSAAQLIGTLRNKGGIKAEELANAGITDQAGNLSPEWQSKGKIAPEDLAAHFEQHLPEIEETVLQRPSNSYFYRNYDEWMDAIESAERRGDWDEASELTQAWESLEGHGPSGTPKYEQYTLPGGENYREVLLRYQPPKQRVGVTSTGHIFTEEELSDPIVRRTAEKIGLTMEDRPIYDPQFKTGHWDEPNILAHIRMADRTGPNGEKILHVEEVQSDWGQKGKKEGFYDPKQQDQWAKEHQKLQSQLEDIRKKRAIREQMLEEHVLDTLGPEPISSFGGDERQWEQYSAARRNVIESDEELKKIKENQNNIAKAIEDSISAKPSSKVSTAPYVTSTQGWTDLALKRILKEAAEGGYDKVVWTPGAEQAKRYDLSKQISKLEYDPQDKTLNYTTNEGVFVRHPDYVEPNQLPNVIGKEATEKLLAQEKHKITGRQTLSTSDLQIGGEGMKDYYDNILPKRLQAVAQKHDKTAKISQSLIKTHGDEWPFSARIAHDGENYWVAGQSPSVSTSAEQQLSPKFKSYEEASNHRDLLYQGFNQPVSALNITPQMRESILKGQEGYARGGDVNREEFRTGGSPDLDVVRQALEQVADPLSQNPELAQKAVDIAAQAYKVPTGNITAGSSYYGHKGPMDVSDIQTTLEPLPGVSPLEKKPMSWEDFYKIGKGGTMINLGGDRSRLGRLTHINNKQLAWPVDLHAGPEYMLEPNPEAVWANALGHTTGLKKKIIQASDRGPVYGVYTPMGPKTVDSSFQMFDALLSQIAADPPSKKSASQFDEAMKKGLYVMGSTDKAQKDRAKEIEKMENWPGILNTLEAREHAKGLPGSTRSLIVKYLDRASWNKLGFPHVGVTRAAITNPELLGAPSNMMGHRIVELSPKDIEETAFKHNTYASPTAGKYVGDVPLVQRQYAMPDVTENFLSRRVGQNQDVIMHPYSLQSSGRDAARKMFEEQKQSQIVGQKMLDSIQKGLEKQKHYGLARGGDVMHTRKVPKPHTPVVGERQHQSRHPASMIPGIHVVGAIHGIPYFTGKK